MRVRAVLLGLPIPSLLERPINIRDKKAYFSNYGSVVNVFAPGEDMDSLYLNGTTKVISGTSIIYAAPHVAGPMAYLLSTRTKVPSNFWTYGHVGILPGRLSDIPAKTPDFLAYNFHYFLSDKLTEEEHSLVIQEASQSSSSAEISRS